MLQTLDLSQWSKAIEFVHLFEPVCFTQDIDNLQQVWEITRDWNANWNIWKDGQFATLQMDSMESTTQDIFKKLHKLQRELKVCYY